MADYIDREKLIKYIHDNGRNFCITEANRCNFAEIARMVKSEDVAPVVHGEWLCAETDDEQFFLCSVCNDKEYWESNYCPECGAKMDAEQEEPTNGKHDAE